MTVEEQLKLKEEKKKMIKAQLEAAEKEAASSKGSDSSTSSNSSPSGSTAPQRRVLRSAESLVHLKAIVEVQMEEVENAQLKKKKSSNPGELEATMAKLTKELAELDDQISVIVKCMLLFFFFFFRHPLIFGSCLTFESSISESAVSVEEAEEIKKKADAAKEDELKTKRKSGKRKSIMQRLFGGKDKEDSNSLSPDNSDKKGSRRTRGVSSPPGSIQPINPEASSSAPSSPSNKDNRDVRSSSPSAVRPSISISSASSDTSTPTSSPSASPSASPSSSSSRRNSTPVKPAIIVSSDKTK
jgi:hypothetical protein